jgi:hypothetical protein
MRTVLKWVLVVATCAALAACNKSGKGIKLGNEHVIGDDATFSIHAADQSGGGKAVKIPEVYLKEKGYLVIHADEGGAPGEQLGVSELLDAGETKNVRVKLDKPLKATAKVFPMLHTENNGNTTYDGVTVDLPAKANNQVVTIAITVTVR